MKPFVVIVYVVVFWGLLPLLLGLLAVALGSGPVGPQPDRIGLVAVFLLGAILSLRAGFVLYRHGGGLPISALPPTRLVETGPFHRCRHPLYLGYHLMLGSTALFLLPGSATGWVFGPFFLAGWMAYTVCEERGLLRRYGAAFERYRSEVPLLVPRFYSIAQPMVSIIARLVFRLRIRGLETIPAHGPVLFLSLHRCYLDPFLIAGSVDRPVHYVTTESMFRNRLRAKVFTAMNSIPITRYRNDTRSIRESIRIIRSGGCIGLFPEGGRSWFGEVACDTSAIRFAELLKRAGATVITVDIEGAFSCFPRATGFPVRVPLTLRLCRSDEPVETIMRRLARAAIAREAREIDLPSRPRRHVSGYAALFARCPVCEARFTVTPESHSRAGRLFCARCGSSFEITRHQRIITTYRSREASAIRQAPERLIELERPMMSALTRSAGILLFRAKLATDSGYLDALLTIGEESVRIEITAGQPVLHTAAEVRRIAYEEIRAVLIEGRKDLEIYRFGSSERIAIRLAPEHALGVEIIIRARSFGNPYARVRGSARRRIDGA